jgi:hypothetical protein
MCERSWQPQPGAQPAQREQTAHWPLPVCIVKHNAWHHPAAGVSCPCAQEAFRRHQGQRTASEYGLYPAVLSKSVGAQLVALVPRAKESALALFSQPAAGPRSTGGQPEQEGDSGADSIIAECVPSSCTHHVVFCNMFARHTAFQHCT